MNEPNDIEKLAAEYALGTLEHEVREAVSGRRASDPRLDAAITDWELRLVPLSELIDAREPDQRLLADILDRIPTDSGSTDVHEARSAEVIDLRKHLTRWKRIALATSLLAASLATVVIVRPLTTTDDPQNYVAVFNKDDQQPAFLLSIDLESRALSIQAIDAEPQPEKTYQLWILEENIGPGPQSLGLLNAVGSATEKTLDQFDVEILKAATYGISVEPPGGSPTGKPSPGAIHGFLYPVEDEPVK